MLPMFLAMGFNEAAFLTFQENIPEQSLAHVQAFACGKPYDSPASYYERVKSYLADQGITEGVWAFYSNGQWGEWN